MPPQTVRLFVSSPGDVTEERIVAARVTQRLQDALVPRVILAPVFWEHEPLRATETFQSQIVRPSDTDIVICILWSRLGTRLPPQFTRPDGSRYASGTEYEFEDAVTGYRHNGKPDLLVYRKVTEPVISLKDTQVARDRLAQMEALEQFITKWFHGLEDGSLIAAFHTFDTSAQFESLLEVHLRKLIEPRLPARVSEDVIRHAPPSWPHGSPFRGLEVFNVEHAPIFFGRTRAVGEVIHILRQQATGGRVFVLVLGMSGSGKSSLIRAGILPTMTHPGVIEGVGLWRWGICRLSNISSDLPFGIAKLLLDDNVLPELAAAGVNAEALAEAFRSAPQQAKLLLRIGLSRASEHVAKREQLAAPPEARLVLVVDQMEELFTLDALSQSDRDGCIALLSILANSGVVWVIGSMRSDFYHRTAELPSLVALTEGLGQYHLLPPSHAEILQIIREPVRAAGLTFEEDPATGIGLDTVIEQAAIRHPEALPLLEFTLDELFKQRSENNMLTMAAYKQLGGLEGALGRRAEEAFQSLSEAEKTALPSVLRALVNVTLSDNSQITARTASMSMFPEGTPARALVDTFLSPEYRLFVADGDGQGTRVRVAHEALFSVWELARDIILTDREFLRTRQRVEMASARWEEEQQPDDLLLPLGKPLAEAEDLLVQRRKELSPEVVAYIETSSTVQREKERLAREAAEREAETAHLLARRRRAAAITRRVAFFGLLAWLAFFLWLGEWYWSPVRHLVFDTSQRLFPRQVEHFPVVIIDIDEASLAALGQWPWPRTRLARLIEAVQRMGTLAVGLNMVMPEADRLSPSVFVADRPDVSAALRDELATLPSNDAILAETLRRVPTVVGRAGRHKPGEDRTPVDAQTPVRVYEGEPAAHVQPYRSHLSNVAPIEKAAAGHGYLDAPPDADGVVRTVPLLLSIHGKLAPAFALELVRVAVGVAWYGVHGGPRGVHGVQIGTSFIPTDLDGRLRLYYSWPDPRRRVSALAVLKGDVDSDALAQKVAIIGVTVAGLTDVVATPVSTLTYGVEVQAQMVENILAGVRLVRPSTAGWVELIAFLTVAAILTAFLPHLRPGLSVLICLVVAALLVTGSLVSFVDAKLLFDPTFPILGNTLILGVLLIAGFAATDRARQELELALEAARIEKLQIAGELRAAREIQMGMVPSPGAIKNLPTTIAFHAFLEPAEAVGGDLYDALMLDARRFFFLIGDVSGKGVPASLFMALSKTLCKSAALREHIPTHELMILVNEELSRENAADLFVAAVVGIIDINTGIMELCNAGHEAPILLRAGAAPCVLETAGGPPLCILEDFLYTSGQIQLQGGDMIVMMTDGVTEAQDPEQRLYGLERALACLATMHTEAHGGQNVTAVCEGLYSDVQCFAKGAAPADDITIMAIRFTAPLSSSTPTA